MKGKDDQFIEFKDIDNIKKALENAEIDYEELISTDGTQTLIETYNVQFDFDSNGNLLNIEPFRLSVQ